MRITFLATLAGLFGALCVWTAHTCGPRIEADLSKRVEQIVAPVPTLALTVDGRDITLIGRVRGLTQAQSMQQAIDDLVRSIRDLSGVRAVHEAIDIVQPAAAHDVATSGPAGERHHESNGVS